MPQTHKIVNGKLVLVGAQRSSDLVPRAQPPAQRPARPPQPKPQPKPWWAQLANHVMYELRGRPATAPFPQPPVTVTPPARPGARPQVRVNLPVAAAQTLMAPVLYGPQRQLAIGAVGAADNVLKAGYSWLQRAQGKPSADPSSGWLGSALDGYVNFAYQALGATPPSRMTQAEIQGDQNLRSGVLNAALMAVPGMGGLGALTAKTALGGVVRAGTSFALNEAASNFLDNKTSGNIVNTINDTFKLKLPGAVQVGVDDIPDAALKSFGPDAAASAAFGAALGVAVPVIGAGYRNFQNILRNTRAQRGVAAEQAERAKQEAMGLLQKDEDGGLGFTDQARQPPEPPAPVAPPAPPRTPAEEGLDAVRAMEERLGGGPAADAAPATPDTAPTPEPAPARPAPTTEFQDPTQPGADMGAVYEAGQDRPWDYDPSLPESTALGKAVGELSDAELQAVISNPGIPVVDRVNQTIEARGAVDPGPAIDSQMVMAPAGRLAEDYIAGLMRTLGRMEPRQLRQLFDSPANAGLWRRAQALTGAEDITQLSKADMLDTIKAMAAEGQVPITNRLMGAQMMPTGDITPAPQVFQYKGGVNEAGEQLGNSLEGLERWDPKAEGIIQVWRDVNGEIGEPGKVYVVNGHNRLAAANRMGIPSMRVEFLDAPTAAEARLQGAVANVSDGKGTVFDAAKVAREMGITTTADLKKLGKPQASGFWRDGIALSRLPEDVFQGAVNAPEALRPMYRLIGESGASPEIMRSAHIHLTKDPKTSAAELVEMIDWAKAQRNTDAAKASQEQGRLPFEDWDATFDERMLAMQRLASEVDTLLGKEKRLFRGARKNADALNTVGTLDAQAAGEIGDGAARAQVIFKDTKYVTGPVNDLLKEGVERILAGETPGQVAQGIKNRLAAAIQEAMGKEAAPAVDVVQEDMFAAGGRQEPGPAAEPAAPQPIELTDEQRLAAEAQLLNEAIAGGEVRPPNAPIPKLPDPPQVRLDELDLNAPVTPGSKTAQAMADEARLAVEHARMDAAMAEMQEKAAKDAMDYELLTFEEKKELGMTAALDEAITPEVLPPGGMPGESRTPIADALGESLRALAESDARMFREIGGLLGDMRRVADEMAGGGGGGPASPAGRQALPEAPAATPPIEIPAAAGRKITARTSEGRIRGAADALASWTKVPGKDAMPIEKALDLVRAKGAILDPDAIPGLNVDAARNERGMGMSTPTTEAVAAAYRQFYGMPEPAPKAAAPTLAGGPGAAVSGIARGITEGPRRQMWEAYRQGETRLAGVDDPYLDAMQQLKIRQGVVAATRDEFDRLLDRVIAEADRRKAAAPTLAPAPVMPRPLRVVQPAAQPELLLPQDLQRSTPRYGRSTIAFQSDLDRAAYVLANDAVKPSKAADKFRQVVKEAGLDIAEVVAHGKRVKAALKAAGAGSQGEIQLPPQPWRGGRSSQSIQPGTSKAKPQKGLSLDELRRLSDKLADGTATPEDREAVRKEFDRIAAIIKANEDATRAKEKAADLKTQADVDARLPEMLAAWRKVAGDDIHYRILDTNKVMIDSAAWGGDGVTMSEVLGMYETWKDTAHIYRQARILGMGRPRQRDYDSLLQTGMHESVHRIVRLSLGDEQMAILNTRFARFKAYLAKDEWGAARGDVAYDELLTDAAADYIVATIKKPQNPTSYVLETVIRRNLSETEQDLPDWVVKLAADLGSALSKVYDFVERSYNFFQGRGFRSISSVFKEIESGAAAGTHPELRHSRQTAYPETMEAMIRDVKVRKWQEYTWNGRPIPELRDTEAPLSWRDGQELFDDVHDFPSNAPPPTKADITRTQQQIDAIDQQMAEIRAKAAQEGC